MKIPLIILMLLGLFYSCTIEGNVSNKTETVFCVDTRDGETFSFKTKDIKNIQVGILSDSCYDVIDDKGFRRKLCKSQEKYFKCKSFPNKESV